MKKQLLTLIGCMCSLTTFAQFNTVYSYTLDGSSATTNAIDVANTNSASGRYCVLATATSSDPGLALPSNYILLKEMDNSGTVFFDKAYYLSLDSATLYLEHLTPTKDNGFIVVGMLSDSHVSVSETNPFAFKVNSAGLFQWARVYRSKGTIGNYGPVMKIIRDLDDTTENYVINAIGVPRDAMGPGDELINLLKIDVNGNLIWNNKYEQTNRGSYPYVWLRDVPTALTFVPAGPSNKSFYFVAGTRWEWYSTDVDYLFYLGFDNDGNIINNYKFASIPSYSMHHDALYNSDPAEQNIVMSYTLDNNNLAGAPPTASEIGFMKFDRSLNVLLSRYYWDKELTENYGMGIKKTKDHAFIIGGWTVESPTLYYSMCMLKLSPAGVPVFYKRYNESDGGYFGNLISSVDPSSGLENYVVAGQESYASPNTRVFATDINGRTCGYEDRQPQVGNWPIVDSSMDYEIFPQENSYTLKFKTVKVEIDEDPCVGQDFTGRMAHIAEPEVKLYPTLIQEGTDALNVEINSDAVSTVAQVEILSIDGRCIINKSFNINEGLNKISLPLLNMVPGTYFVKTNISAKNFQQVIRVTKM